MQLAPFYPILYRILKPIFPTCLWNGDEASPTIALTFDDGPHPEYTPQLLKVLDEYQIEASFFWLGVCVDRNPSLAKEIHQRGHWIGLHGYHHHSFPLLTPDELKQSLQKTQTAIANACQIDRDRVRDVRPPNGLFTPKVLQLLHQNNYRPVMWSVVPEDWVRPGIAVASNRVMANIGNGSIIVLHDGCCGGQDVSAIAANLIPRLLQKGYRFVTIDELWRQKHP
ncbi:chitooligosaccharide deacetylase NodB-like protein [Hydrococcus rivularis NIES-593]|uniref:Chitooligosaccharide deacetylase NodB-like protein n=1 Tax=Hydrococcus rivularis NIES-593 TaxID=1921803 RepID=A0A1U7HKJ5_9CYAN|nr:polysaccharide deacetylase family protein [Hydrococcus rivularis]OKH24106.1 chitooligosaccharide deacetylase NodB-like protein [Hydrococcus rivularis NIES-593]